MNVHFACTRCGACCRHDKLPLNVAEAVVWLQAGHRVQILCDAIPWPGEPPPEDLPAAHRARRSTIAMSGSMPTRITVILAADIGSACPNLGPDDRCSAYDRRPIVCRVYPFEINPFIRLEQARKKCPTEAWSPTGPLIQRQGRTFDPAVRADIERSRAIDERDVPVKARLCAALGISHAALANEGFAVHSPDPQTLLRELIRASVPDGAVPDNGWNVVSNRRETVLAVNEIGGAGAHVADMPSPCFQYLGFLPTSA